MGVAPQGRANREPPVRTEIQTPLDFNPGQSKIDSDNEDDNEHDGVRPRAPAPPNADTLCPRHTLPSVSPFEPRAHPFDGKTQRDQDANPQG
jgi:hypothetical protein